MAKELERTPLNIKQVAALLGLTARRVQQLVSKGAFSGAQKENGKWQIPSGALKVYERDQLSSDGLEDIPAIKREEATRRLSLVEQLNKQISLGKKRGINKTETIKAFAKQNDIPLRTLERWRANYRREGILGLVDKRGRPGEIIKKKIDHEVLLVGSRIALGQIFVDSLRCRDREQLLSIIGSGVHVRGEVQRIVRKLLGRKF